MQTRNELPDNSQPGKSLHWLITGGAGFIGCNLIKQLLAEGTRYIRVLDNLSVGTRSDLGRVCTFVEATFGEFGQEKNEESNLYSETENNGVPVIMLIVGDIMDPEMCTGSATDIDIIVHLAANTGVAPSVGNPRLDMETNVIGTLNMLEAARQNGLKRFIFASSGAPVGECEPPIHEELAPHPVSPYGASKLAGEGYCSAYYRTFGVETVILRFGNVYGPLSTHKSSVVAKFIRQAMNGETLEIYGDGQQSRDFIYIEDLVRAIRLAANVSGIGGHIFQIATGRETTVGEVVEMIVPILSHFGHRDLLIRYIDPRTGDVRRNFSDATKAGQMLGWHADVEIFNGLKQTVKWFVENLS